MNIITYNEALTSLCDSFDSLISPRTIARSNTNIVYLLFKAFAKGWEVINNTVVYLSNKFNPANCSDEDLVSVGFLVGTEKKKGAVSGLLITALNNATTSTTLLAGTYTYALDSNTVFECTLTSDVEISAYDTYQMTFLSKDKGAFPVTSQQDISLSALDSSGNALSISEALTFSNTDNANLLGYTDETNLAFRQRILEDTERQDSINELKLKIRNLPYVFDCEIVFNQGTSSITVGSFTIPPYYMLLLVSTALYTEEIATIVAQSAIYPTVNVENSSHEVTYKNSVFASGEYKVYLNDFSKKEFTASITYKIDTNYISNESAMKKMRSLLFNSINTNIHKDSITTDDFFTVIENASLQGIKLYGVSLAVEGQTVPYIQCLKTEIGELTDITFNPVV